MKRVLIDLAVALAVLVAWHAVAWFCTWRVSWLWEWSPSQRFALLCASILAVLWAEMFKVFNRLLRRPGIDP